MPTELLQSRAEQSSSHNMCTVHAQPTPTLSESCKCSSSNGVTRFPFTASQWQELEHQALVFKYMVSGMPIPLDLLFTIRTSLDSSLSSKFLIHQPQHMGWNSFQMGFGRKIDPEPGRCRRTDGKKWRCSKEAYPDSKYCERHMHRGRNRSRKPVEILSPPPAAATPPPRNPHPPPPSSSSSESRFLYPQFSSSPSPAFSLSSQESTNFFLHSRPPPKDFRESEEHAFLSADSNSYSSSKKHSSYSSDFLSGQKLQSLDDHSYRQYHDDGDDHHFYSGEAADEQPKKVMHHFLDEWVPKESDSWNNSEEKMPSHRTQLSISIPNSVHDFFMTQK